ncbi:hypothetical protein C8A03DRAFT_46201 [Achaetomium macrosporum]|uniref:Uncharacterized protein n=1 Tax=Achaetomium macrosporum TaxID=79813 RepID=A0AAN7H8Z1_9PEZI|nr:hypothetical protein C8A03DRAFT_46201 [Achaetomium macrosporum]
MANPKDPDNIINRVIRNGREYIETSDGSSWTRRLDRATGQPLTDKWSAVEKPPPPPEDDQTTPESRPRYLTVVAEHQAEGEAKHWSLFAHHPNDMGTGAGRVWQVTGDAELMRFNHAEGVDKMGSPDLAWFQVLNNELSEEQFKRVDMIASEEKAPSAPNRAAVTENCQGWVLRVLGRLVKEGIVEERMVGILRGYMDAIRR